VLAAAPLFETLDRTTALAEQMIRAALQAALAAAPARAPGAFTVIALGRAGIREFDLASDADLAFFFTLPEPDPEAKVFWIHTAERLISVLSAHTGEGTIFSVDTRLRPRGREGELVDTAAAVEDYFQTRAEPWEAITYMKSRALAGDLETGTDLLTRVQNRIGARFGSGPGAARQLAEMRKRLEGTTTPHNFLKTAPGGYYDIDFLLTYLRLCAAGVFYPSLNTLERLAVVERMGQITVAQGEVLREGAIFLRALQHAMRVVSGRSDTELPQGGPAAVHLAQLAERWFPESLQGRPLPETIEDVMARVRRVFLEVFEN
jgi:glutamate-ammonia-ligase adenylyltransferase